MKQKCVIELDYNELDRLIEEHFNLRPGSYVSVAYNEWNNYSNYSFDVKAKPLNMEELANMMQAVEKTYESTKGYGGNTFRQPAGISTDALLDHICANGKLVAGEYLVTVFW